MSRKPLGGKSYGSIPHLLGSRRGPTDRGCNDGQHRICCERTRDKRDRIIVTEKLDGSNVAAAKIGGEIIALTRSGYLATTSPYEQHHAWARWVAERAARFDALLAERERVCGEWMIQAHGSVYDLPHEPFVAFGIRGDKHREVWDGVVQRCSAAGLVTPTVLHDARAPMSIEGAMAALGEYGHHGAKDPAEGAVWRVERIHKNGSPRLDFLAKFVRPGKEDGKYFESVTGNPTVWNNWPEKVTP